MRNAGICRPLRDCEWVLFTIVNTFSHKLLAVGGGDSPSAVETA